MRLLRSRTTIWLLVLLLTTLSACGGEGGEGDDPTTTVDTTAGDNGTTTTPAPDSDTTAPSEPVEITWMLFWNTSGRDALGEPLVEKFNQEHPNIRVEVISVPFGEFKERAISLHAADQTPDVITPQPDMIRDFVELGILQPLDSFLDADPEYAASLAAGALLPVEGAQYHVPTVIIPTGMFYNITMLEEAGVTIPDSWDWENLQEAMEAVNDPASGRYATALALCESVSANVSTQVFPFIFGAGGQLVDDSGKAALDSPEVLQAAEYYMNIAENYTVPGILSECLADNLGHFVSETTAFHFQNTGAVGVLRSENPELDWGFASVEGPAGREGIRLTSWNLGMGSTTEHADAAWTFIKWLTTTGNSEIGQVGGNIPANADAASDSWITDDPIMQVAASLASDPNAVLTDVLMPAPSQMYLALQTQLQEVISGNKTLEEALATANEEWNALLNE